MPTVPLVAREMGGVALNDTSQGLLVKPWRCRYIEGDFVVDAQDVEPTTIFSAEGVTEFDLAFDQNMNPFLAFVQDGTAKFRWFDPLAADYVITTMASDVVTPKCSLDDKRRFNIGNSDIILSYVRSGSLYYRTQRERYEVERLVTGGVKALRQAGMNTANQFQWRVA